MLPCRTLVEELTGPITYLLGALSGEAPQVGQVGQGCGLPSCAFWNPLIPGLFLALSETQHVLLAEALKALALSETFKLVRGPRCWGRG